MLRPWPPGGRHPGPRPGPSRDGGHAGGGVRRAGRSAGDPLPGAGRLGPLLRRGPRGLPLLRRARGTGPASAWASSSTVDGLNVISGERERAAAACTSSTPGSDDVQGWRTSLDEVRQFTFVDKRASYAARSAKANEKMGWIEIAVYRERRAFVARPRGARGPRAPRPSSRRATGPAGARRPRPKRPATGRGGAPKQRGDTQARSSRGPAGASARTTRPCSCASSPRASRASASPCATSTGRPSSPWVSCPAASAPRPPPGARPRPSGFRAAAAVVTAGVLPSPRLLDAEVTHVPAGGGFPEGWEQERGSTLKILAALDDASLGQAVAKDDRTLGRLAWHLATTPGEMMERTGLKVAGPSHDHPRPPPRPRSSRPTTRPRRRSRKGSRAGPTRPSRSRTTCTGSGGPVGSRCRPSSSTRRTTAAR